MLNTISFPTVISFLTCVFFFHPLAASGSDSRNCENVLPGSDLPDPAETLAAERAECPQNDKYFQGYIQALIDMNYYEYRVTVTVQKGIVYLYNLPRNPTLRKSIIYFVDSIPGADCVKLECPPEEEDEACESEQAKMYPPGKTSGVWLPQQTVLFSPLLADPRQSGYSGACRWGDQVIGKRGAAVSFGEDFPIYRWRNVGTHNGDVQIGLEGCVFAVFDMTCTDTELVNADYFISIPVTWAYNAWSWRFRIYHLSSHLGDEYMDNHPGVMRFNKSLEAADVFLSYQWTYVRLYGGVGSFIHVDPEFPLKKPYVQYGIEFRFLGKGDFCNALYMQPYLAMNNQNASYNHWNNDFTAALGLEWSKVQGVGRKVRLFTQYHNGFSAEGQFCKEKTRYFELGLNYGF